MANSGLKYYKDPNSKGIVEFILQVWQALTSGFSLSLKIILIILKALARA